MRFLRFVSDARFVTVGLLCLTLAACRTTPTDNVQFQRLQIPPSPAVAQGYGNRFLLSFTVINPTNQDQPAGKYRVRVHTIYTANGSPCTKNHFVAISNFMAKDTGKSAIVDFDFAKPYYDASDPCFCSTGTQCDGGIIITLEYATGAKQGERVPGSNTKLNVAWDKTDDISKVVTTEN